MTSMSVREDTPIPRRTAFVDASHHSRKAALAAASTSAFLTARRRVSTLRRDIPTARHALTEHMAGAASMDENWFGPAELV